MAGNVLSEIGPHINRGDLETAIDLLAQAIQNGYNADSFEVHALLAILSSRSGDYEAAKSDGMKALSLLSDNAPYTQEITNGITVLTLWEDLENACGALGDYPNEKLFLNKITKHTGRLVGQAAGRAICCEYELNGIDAALRLAEQYKDVPDDTENHSTYHAVKAGLLRVLFRKLSGYSDKNMKLPDGPIELLEQLANYVFMMIDSADSLSGDSQKDGELRQASIRQGENWLVQIVVNFIKLGGTSEIYKDRNFPAAKIFVACNKRLATLGNGVGAYNLGRLYIEGASLTKDDNKAFYHMQKAYEAGCKESLPYLALFYHNGTGTEPDFKKAFSYAQEGVTSGPPAIKGLLGSMYLNGEGTEKDVDKGLFWLQTAESEGDSVAKNILINEARNNVENFDEKLQFINDVNAKIQQDASSLDSRFEVGQKYTRYYREIEKYYIAPGCRVSFIVFCVSAQPEALLKEKNFVTVEYFNSQLEKYIKQITPSEERIPFIRLVAKKADDLCFWEFMQGAATGGRFNDMPSWQMVCENILAKASAWGWDKRMDDGELWNYCDHKPPTPSKSPTTTASSTKTEPSSATAARSYTSSSSYSNLPSPRSRSHCYVATAVYGTYDCPEVWTLRRFRDNILAKNFAGRAFIMVYYAASPTIIKYFGKNSWFKNFWKKRLDTLVQTLNTHGIEDKTYTDPD